MKVLMLGWEYPPMITGGLATASEGITRALAARGIDIDFVLPRRSGKEDASHMSIFAAEELKAVRAGARPQRPGAPLALSTASSIEALLSSYARPRAEGRRYLAQASPQGEADATEEPAWLRDPVSFMRELVGCQGLEDPLFREVFRYAREAAQLPKDWNFDLVHAHDWLTMPAGVLVAKAAGVPLVVHVHSLEFDRCGDGGNQVIRAIEQAGIRQANLVIAVSEYTRRMVIEKVGAAPEKVFVAHNAVAKAHDHAPKAPPARKAPPKGAAAPAAAQPRKKRVLFLGRITYQKGPDTFVEAAARVLTKFQDVVFVMAGAGDMLPRVRERIRELGIESHFEFPGFVTGARLQEQFRSADLYVMPSVSEPFGIAPLEALSHGTPAIISKQSGVSEVLSHVLKTDFWDVRKMADFILNVLRSPELSSSMMAMSRNEVGRLRWENTASQVIAAYGQVVPKKPDSAITEVS